MWSSSSTTNRQQGFTTLGRSPLTLFLSRLRYLKAVFTFGFFLNHKCVSAATAVWFHCLSVLISTMLSVLNCFYTASIISGLKVCYLEGPDVSRKRGTLHLLAALPTPIRRYFTKSQIYRFFFNFILDEQRFSSRQDFDGMGAAHASSSRCWSPPCCVWLISRREASEPQLCRLLLCRVCVWLMREDALSSTITAALRSVVQTKAHKLSSITQRLLLSFQGGLTNEL